MKRLRLWLARYRLRGHMYDRLVMGGSPDCPCSDCKRRRAVVRDLTGEEWSDPTRARYYRDVFEIGDPWKGDYRVPVLDPEFRRRTERP